MESFLEQLSSLSWWLSVVVVGIVINLVTAYAKPKLDSSLSSVSGWWRDRTEQQKAERTAKVDFLRSSKDEQIHAALDDLRDRIRALYLLLVGVFFMLLPAFLELGKATKPFVLGLSALTYFASFVIFTRAARTKALLNSARAQSRDQCSDGRASSNNQLQRTGGDAGR